MYIYSVYHLTMLSVAEVTKSQWYENWIAGKIVLTGKKQRTRIKTQRHSERHESHAEWPEIEHGPPRREVGDKPPEPWQSLIYICTGVSRLYMKHTKTYWNVVSKTCTLYNWCRGMEWIKRQLLCGPIHLCLLLKCWIVREPMRVLPTCRTITLLQRHMAGTYFLSLAIQYAILIVLQL